MLSSNWPIAILILMLREWGFLDIREVVLCRRQPSARILTFIKQLLQLPGNHDNYIYNKWFTETHNGATEEKKVIKDSVNGDRTEYTYKFRVNTNIDLAKNYKGGLLLVTGDMDDNVHPAHTYRMADALIKAGKNFDMLVLPGQDHGFSGAAELFFERKLWAHFAKYLLGDSSADYKSSIGN